MAAAAGRVPLPVQCPTNPFLRRHRTHLQQIAHGLGWRCRKHLLVHARQLAVLLNAAQRHLMNAIRSGKGREGERAKERAWACAAGKQEPQPARCSLPRSLLNSSSPPSSPQPPPDLQHPYNLHPTVCSRPQSRRRSRRRPPAPAPTAARCGPCPACRNTCSAGAPPARLRSAVGGRAAAGCRCRGSGPGGHLAHSKAAAGRQPTEPGGAAMPGSPSTALCRHTPPPALCRQTHAPAVPCRCRPATGPTGFGR